MCIRDSERLAPIAMDAYGAVLVHGSGPHPHPLARRCARGLGATGAVGHRRGCAAAIADSP
eukprot:8032096-Lingulodinium_polyedra.AAC.1